ncbi:complement component receptor 1-like protein [Erythrolamprus reginae]|uniref:complement component receptor 1-like protein n=1 Tax=Erythrolamprus reginae TaxID=121349 RepID=UPI00396CB1CD
MENSNQTETTTLLMILLQFSSASQTCKGCECKDWSQSYFFITVITLKESADVSPGIPMGLSSCSNVVLTVVLVPLFLSSTVLSDCLKPTLPPHSQLRSGGDLNDSYVVTTSLQLTCFSGYEFVPGARPSLTCNNDSTWSKLTELCQGKRCPVPRLENGRIALSDDLRFNETVTLECYYGFRLIGEGTLQCVLTGSAVNWHRDIPFCEPIPCARPAIISNGRFNGASAIPRIPSTMCSICLM